MFAIISMLCIADRYVLAILLEPIVNMEVTVPEDKMGTITGDLSGKRGRIQGQGNVPARPIPCLFDRLNRFRLLVLVALRASTGRVNLAAG